MKPGGPFWTPGFFIVRLTTEESMPLKRRVTRLEDVAETDRGHYVRTEDGFKLDLDGGDDETATLQRTLEHEKRQRAEAVKKVIDLEGRYKGIDPEKVREAQDRLVELEDERLKAEGKHAEIAERKYAKATEAHEAEKASLTALLEKEKVERTKIEREHDTLIVRQTLESTLLGMGADPLGLGYAVSLHLPKWTLAEDKQTPVQLDTDKKVRRGVNPDLPLTMREDLTDWQKTDRFAQKFFLPSAGGGASGEGGRRNGTAVVISRTDAHDHGKFMAAKDQAEKAGVPLQVANT